MAGIGTVVNVLAILAGGCAGLVLKGGLKARYQQAVIQAMGLCVLFIGGAGALNGMLSVRDGALTGLDTRGTLGMILALPAAQAEQALSLLTEAGEKAYLVGQVVEGNSGVELI